MDNQSYQVSKLPEPKEFNNTFVFGVEIRRLIKKQNYGYMINYNSDQLNNDKMDEDTYHISVPVSNMKEDTYPISVPVSNLSPWMKNLMNQLKMLHKDYYLAYTQEFDASDKQKVKNLLDNYHGADETTRMLLELEFSGVDVSKYDGTDKDYQLLKQAHQQQFPVLTESEEDRAKFEFEISVYPPSNSMIKLNDHIKQHITPSLSELAQQFNPRNREHVRTLMLMVIPDNTVERALLELEFSGCDMSKYNVDNDAQSILQLHGMMKIF